MIWVESDRQYAMAMVGAKKQTDALSRTSDAALMHEAGGNGDGKQI
jgi:hypothetical protein